MNQDNHSQIGISSIQRLDSPNQIIPTMINLRKQTLICHDKVNPFTMIPIICSRKRLRRNPLDRMNNPHKILDIPRIDNPSHNRMISDPQSPKIITCLLRNQQILACHNQKILDNQFQIKTININPTDLQRHKTLVNPNLKILDNPFQDKIINIPLTHKILVNRNLRI